MVPTCNLNVQVTKAEVCDFKVNLDHIEKLHGVCVAGARHGVGETGEGREMGHA